MKEKKETRRKRQCIRNNEEQDKMTQEGKRNTK